MKNKYLAAEAEQQKLERQHAAQLDFMRKTLTHLAAAAQGLDAELDRDLRLLKDKMRGASGEQVVAQMEKVQQSVVRFEREREQHNATALTQFSTLVSQLQALKLPAELRKKLLTYQKSLGARLDSWRAYPELISELHAIQKLALDAAMKPDEGFLQRLKGGKKLQSQSADKKNPTEPPPTLPPEQRFESPENEDSYEQVAKRINRTLSGLVDNIEVNDLVKHKVDIVQSRISRGLDWFALAVTLEDIRDILMQRYLRADKEFGDYLKKVNDDLNNIREKLGLAHSTEEGQNQAVSALTNAVDQHVNNMRNSLNREGSVDVLKNEIETQIEEIQKALAAFRQQQTQSSSLSEQLQGLLEQVKSIETESQKTQILLEEERYKATHDALTQLPNREAYNERVWQEYQRFKRYNRPLSLAVCDIDHFKKINDNFGHQIGDKVLKLFAGLLSKRLRQVDFVARYGGEEFVILLPETTAEQAQAVLEKIRKTVSQSAFRFKDEPVKISASFGIAQFMDDEEVEGGFARADAALYQAKNQGRNRCIIADKP